MDGGSTDIVGGESDLNIENLPGWRSKSNLTIWTLVLVGAFLLNAILLFAFIKRSGLRTISNRFVMNLAVSNLLTCTVLHFFLIMDFVFQGVTSSSFAKGLCAISEGSTALVTTSSVLSVLLIAVDQYFAVVDPLRYRTRIDKLKCGLLILAIWSVAAFFGLLATLNPTPRSIWHVCSINNMPTAQNSSSLDQLVEVDESWSDTVVIFNSSSILIGTERSQINGVLAIQSSDTCASRDIYCYLTYGFVYSVAYTLFVFLLPFIGVCWIYVSIYTAARKNFERTRRTGSRPILSSNSFCDEYYYPVRQELMTEEIRRLPKISSLSSIDESLEFTPSQLVRSKSTEFAKGVASNIGAMQDSSSAVIFTLGAQKQPGVLTKDHDHSKVPISTLRSKFLEKSDFSKCSNDLVKSKFPEMPSQRRKSSYDLMYEEMIR